MIIVVGEAVSEKPKTSPVGLIKITVGVGSIVGVEVGVVVGVKDGFGVAVGIGVLVGGDTVGVGVDVGSGGSITSKL